MVVLSLTTYDSITALRPRQFSLRTTGGQDDDDEWKPLSCKCLPKSQRLPRARSALTNFSYYILRIHITQNVSILTGSKDMPRIIRSIRFIWFCLLSLGKMCFLKRLHFLLEKVLWRRKPSRNFYVRAQLHPRGKKVSMQKMWNFLKLWKLKYPRNNLRRKKMPQRVVTG